jgi:hypothetical protein
MLTDTITLSVITEKEESAWLESLEHYVYWPRRDYDRRFIKANQVAEKARELDRNTRRIRVSSTATVSEVIAEARECFAGYDQDFEVAWTGNNLHSYPVKYHLSSPCFTHQSSDDSIRISDLGLVDGDLVIISRWVIRPARYSLPAASILGGAVSAQKFQEMVWENQNPDDPMLLATLLYTDEDIELAKYVRKHYDELHQMSGSRVITYVDCSGKRCWMQSFIALGLYSDGPKVSRIAMLLLMKSLPV